MVEVFHRAGLTIHAHCNGDQATEVFVDAVEAALQAHPRWDHRHTVQHCQMTTPAQYRRMAALGMSANIFSNHIYYWGDQHRDRSIGPERAAKMDACATALHEGVKISIHSDAPVTPMGHLRTMWCAVNRLTSTGKVLGPEERISVHDALFAATVGAAYQLKLDHVMGSIEVGKYADFAILDDDPLTVDPVALKDIGVWGTMVGGIAFPALSAGSNLVGSNIAGSNTA
jgi:predicted amidohydrolase YtcJ